MASSGLASGCRSGGPRRRASRRHLAAGARVAIESIGTSHVDRATTIAIDESITFYDAAYVACAEREELTFVTEDGGLLDVAGRYVEATSIEDR